MRRSEPKIVINGLANARYHSSRLKDQIEELVSFKADLKDYENYLRSGGAFFNRHRLVRSGRFPEQRKEELEKVRNRIEKVQEQIAEMEERTLDIDIWIEEKETAWANVDEKLLTEQMREIYRSARELSLLFLGKVVELEFELKKDGPLGYIPISFARSSDQKIYLSIEPLVDQAEHCVDLYRALIVHELGHLVLHMKEEYRTYRKFRRIFESKMKVDSRFFSLFNILLDEHLERRLRDRKKEWRRWFNRLEFYHRRIKLSQFRTRPRAASSGRDMLFPPAPTIIDLENWDRDGLVKLYDLPVPSCAIQCPQLLNMNFGFNGLFSFYYLLRHPLPRHNDAHEPEKRIGDAISLLPKNFVDLDVFELHNLAARVYEILFPPSGCKKINKEKKGKQLKKVRLKEGKSEHALFFPAEEREGEESFLIDLSGGEKNSGGGASRQGEVEERRSVSTEKRKSLQFNPEGEPQQKEEKKKVAKTERFQSPSPAEGWGRFRGGGGRGGKNKLRGGITGSTYHRKSRTSRKRGRNKGSGGNPYVRMSARAALSAKMKSGKLSIREKARLQKQIQNEKQTQKEKNRALSKKIAHKENERARNTEENQEHYNSPPIDKFEEKMNRSREESAKSDVRSLDLPLAEHLNELLEQVKREFTKSPDRPDIPESSEHRRAPDFKNTENTRSFPPANAVTTLRVDRPAHKKAVLEVKRYVQLLRPYFARLRNERVEEERLYTGKKLMSSGVKRYFFSKRMDVFRGNRFAEIEDYSDVYIAVLLDSSASMGKEKRFTNGQLYAVLLSECLAECNGVESMFVGYNQNLYLCGSCEDNAVTSLEAKGKTNEAAAIDFVRKEMDSSAAEKKIVLVLSDGLPTSCSVASVEVLVREMSTKEGIDFLYAAFSEETHTAYRRRVRLGEVNAENVVRFGKNMIELLA